MSDRFRRPESGVARCCCCGALTHIDPGKSVTLCAVCREQAVCQEQEEFMEFALGHPAESLEASEKFEDLFEPAYEAGTSPVSLGILGPAQA
jgi:hypothetical protein